MRYSIRSSLALFLAFFAVACTVLLSAAQSLAQQEEPVVNMAVVATPSTSFVSGHETLAAINDDFRPRNSNDKTHGAYGNWPQTGTQWVQYDWSQPISTDKVDIYWFDDAQGVRLPKACRLKYWDGAKFVDVPNPQGLGLVPNRFNATTFGEITTTKLRLEMDGDGPSSTGILEWKVYDSGKSPDFAPAVKAGVDRVVVTGGPTYLRGVAKGLKSNANVTWTKDSGPGDVTFADATAKITTATFTQPGDYVVKLTGKVGEASASDTLRVRVEAAAPADRLEPVEMTSYKINSPLWNSRAKALIVNWIPHCVDYIENPEKHLDAKGKVEGDGGLDNFIEAGKKLRGEPAKLHQGYTFSNAWVHNTIESMSVALMVDPQGDADMIKAQEGMRKTLDKWIPIVLAAQEPDGYLMTRFTLGATYDRPGNPAKRWNPPTRGEHEGYAAGYFLEAAIAHFRMTGGKDRRLYDAAKRLADCWYNNIGPAPKKTWWDQHEEMEQALVRFARLVNEVEGPGKGQKYIDLAKFLLDSRKGGAEYEQAHLPVTEQYEVVGHAVRASYLLSGMADVAMETHDINYQSAVKSLWSNLINTKYYVTGGIGSGETSEGFGADYSLPNNAYCESCSGCGELFFQWKMNLAYQDAKFADLYEDTIFNAILSDIDLEGKNFTYTNALDSRERRYLWHVCPCCVGNIPRTLLMMPTWMYAKSADAVYVNLYMGSTVNVGSVAGTQVEMVQNTNYPWSGNIAITVNPAETKKFSVHVRIPAHNASDLYTTTPATQGITSISINGKAEAPFMENGYAVVTREWKAGDKIEFDLPMEVQRIKASGKVKADLGRVALRVGPLLFNIETIDQNVESILPPSAALTTEFNPDLLNGVLTIKGNFADGKPMLAIPNFARNNRGNARSVVWIRDQ